MDRTSLELRHKSIQHQGKSTRSLQHPLCVFGVIVVTNVRINPLLCLGRLYCTPWIGLSLSSSLFFCLSAPAEDLSSLQFWMSSPLFVAFVSLTSLILSGVFSPLLSNSGPSLFSPCAPAGCQVQVSFFHSCHRHSPSHSKYTWLNIGPQMIIKTQQPPGLLNFGQQTTP